MEDIKYPDVVAPVIGTNGNAFALIGIVQAALRLADVPADEIKAFTEEATAGDYDHLLATIIKTVHVE